MSLGKHGLGKGISSLIGDYDSSDFETEKLKETGVSVTEIDISRLQANPNQPRKSFDPDSLKDLSQSISSVGIVQPILVEEISGNRYMIIAGERRFRAAKLAGLTTVPCIIRTYSDTQRLEVSLIENIQRENLNPVEEAEAFNYLITEQGLTQEELALKVGKSRPAVANSLRLLALPSNMLQSLKEGAFTPGHARALLSVTNPADREILYYRIIKEKPSVRQTEEYAESLNRGGRLFVKEKKENKKLKSEDILAIEEKFLSATGCLVELKGKINKGKLVIPFDSSDELERIYTLVSSYDKLFEE